MVKGGYQMITAKKPETKLKGGIRMAGGIFRGIPAFIIPGFPAIPGTVQMEQIALKMVGNKKKAAGRSRF